MFLNNDRSSLLKECFGTFSLAIMALKTFEDTAALVMAGHCFKSCVMFLKFDILYLYDVP